MNPAEELTTAELLAELARRFPHGVLAGQLIFTDEREAEQGVLRAWGQPSIVLGLTQKLAAYTNAKMMSAICELVAREQADEELERERREREANGD